MTYTLNKDGDDFEKYYWNKFMKSKFPLYEKYWVANIVPLTDRPHGIHFKKSSDLLNQGFTDEDVCKAQLHYTILRQLVRTFEILSYLKKESQTISDTDWFAEGLFHITAAQDVAFEFLQRNKTPGAYDAWTANSRGSVTKSLGSEEAQRKWKQDNNYPLKQFRDYRNHLTHGRMLPQVQSKGKALLPKVGQEGNYLDWRKITDGFNRNNYKDFDSIDNILEEAWNTTLSYFETHWQNL